MSAMPAARWQSSQRPLFVRTVWVNGLRHAILSAEDPVIHDYTPTSTSRPNSCESSSTSRSSHRGDSTAAEDDLAHCLIKLQLVLGDEELKPKPRKKNHAVKQCQEERCVSVAQAAASMIGRYHRPFVPELFDSSSEDEDEVEEDTWADSYVPEQIQFNPLSERVLRWLDLAAERAVEDVEHPEQPRRRASAIPTAVKPREERRYSVPARRQSSIPTSKVDVEEVLRVNARGLRTRRKRPMLSDDAPTIQKSPTPLQPTRPAPVMLTPSTVSSARTSSTVGSARTPTEGGRPQLHIFMPALPRDVGRLVRQFAGDADTVSEADTLWEDN